VHSAEGKHPAVLIWTDIMGLRLAFKGLARRLAADGYAVLVPNPFYRISKAPVLPEGSQLNDDTRKIVGPMMQALNAEMHVSDARACIEWLDAQQGWTQNRTMGYCMGGPIAVRTAATRADRVGAVATFHGTRMVTDQPDSPHLLFDKLQAACLIAIAENDDQREPFAKDSLRAAATAAGVSVEIEVYPAMHGWCAPDSKAHNPEQAERAWARMLALFKKALV
jgi:carboxymethylenebutenolidase